MIQNQFGLTPNKVKILKVKTGIHQSVYFLLFTFYFCPKGPSETFELQL